MVDPRNPALARQIWEVGALCRAVADALEARFNPVAVRGEVSGFSRASSGHCYFSLKDASGQVRCAMFRRTAGLLQFLPRDGDLVEVEGRLDLYAPRGDLQLIVESLRRAGQGALFEQFLRLKAKLEAEGLFDAARKRELPVFPRRIGLVTSPQAAALHDVLTCLRRRAPHVEVTIAPASVQGAQAPEELVAALEALYARAARGELDVILLVRGGGSIEDLWAFNDERLARAIVRSPVPLVSGVGHETDFTIADFCADLRAPTPTAAAELAAQPRDMWVDAVHAIERRLRDATLRRLDVAAQRLDQAGVRLGRPSARAAQQHMRLQEHAHRLRYAVQGRLHRENVAVESTLKSLMAGVAQNVERSTNRIDRLGVRLAAIDPRLVLQRGYALLSDAQGTPITSVGHTAPGQPVTAALADGEVDLTVASAPRPRA
ncbi:exodeoxyribonuclease VII large subunit [Ramlibacter albus]|uniref:exodeoxyribonuclease VII large subunit n=1 Tax=Ramlibacter albus TaxID=2079448 RepID=UPI0021075D6C|nr:exodeoxyribonuclease VII large subunit [Ramlibacter albus]